MVSQIIYLALLILFLNVCLDFCLKRDVAKLSVLEANVRNLWWNSSFVIFLAKNWFNNTTHLASLVKAWVEVMHIRQVLNTIIPAIVSINKRMIFFTKMV